MCGICGFIGYEAGFHPVIDGLKMLENRGYDSMGICSMSAQNQFVLHKYAKRGNDSALILLEQHTDAHEQNSVLCAHTRWSTHGPKTDVNSHPHLCFREKFSLVHNGIIENYAEVKRWLLKKGIPFKSQTDTEVIVNLISHIYATCGNVEESIEKALAQLEGTWGLVIMCVDTPNKLYCARHGSPLLVGFGETFMMVASEQAGFCRYVNNYICLDNHDVVTLEKKDGKVEFSTKNKYPLRQVTIKDTILTPDPYPYWTIKEIHEQVETSLRAMGMGSRIVDDKTVRLGGLSRHKQELVDIKHLILLGCGTSYYAGLHALDVFRELSGFDTVQIFDGAEFNKYDVPQSGKSGLILLSQSGETKDLHRAVELGKDLGLFMIGVINVVDSLIAREVNCGVYLNAGREAGVASTKAFTSQVIVLYLIAVWFAQQRGINEAKRIPIIEGLRRLSIDIKKTISDNNEICQDIGNYLKDTHSMFVLGKANCEAIAREGSLKIKELSYIHSEAYSSSSLKHGPFSLLEKSVPALIIAPHDENLTKNKGVMEEILARDSPLIVISDADIRQDIKATYMLIVPQNYHFSPLLAAVVIQLIAYHTAIIRGNNCDFPRNLAKSVTV
jgi:glutamine---fructose-6-phosphate transaminase (isomerizing)